MAETFFNDFRRLVLQFINNFHVNDAVKATLREKKVRTEQKIISTRNHSDQLIVMRLVQHFNHHVTNRIAHHTY